MIVQKHALEFLQELLKCQYFISPVKIKMLQTNHLKFWHKLGFPAIESHLKNN
jgi:hypothetical protein